MLLLNPKPMDQPPLQECRILGLFINHQTLVVCEFYTFIRWNEMSASLSFIARKPNV